MKNLVLGFIAAAVVAARELAGVRFGLASIGRLEWTESFLAGNSAIEEERSAIGDFDVAKL